MGSREAHFLLGFLCGCLILNMVLGNKLDRLYEERDSLLAGLEDRDIRLERLEEALKSSGSTIVREIQPHIILKGDRHLQLELEKMVREWLDIFLGRQLDSLDPAAVPFIIHNRVVTISKRRVILKVETVVIGEKLIVFVRPEIETLLPEE